MTTKLENGIALLHAKAAEKGGSCLSANYSGVDQRYRFRCAKGHEWDATFYSVVRRGQWCARCSGRKVVPEEQLEIARSLASHKGGECLTDQYTTSQSQMAWRCAIGHEWQGTYSNIVNRGKWCPWCAGNKVDAATQLLRAQQVAHGRGGDLLTSSYTGNKEPMRWQCAEGHEWNASFGTVVGRGAWCGRCGGNQREAHEQFAKAQEIATKKNGRCLDAEYRGTSAKMLWQCERGHRWRATFYSVVQGETWCPTCSAGLKERLVRHTLEVLFGVPFKKHRPSWLKNPATGRLMELDGFNPELQLAFEYQGPQHYRVVLPFKMDAVRLQKSQFRDEQKQLLCKQHGITLLEIPYSVEAEELPKWISNTIVSTPRSERITPRMGDWRSVQPAEWLKSDSYSVATLAAFAQERSGRCLSTSYVGVKEKYRWRCANGHEWNSTWDCLKNQNTWCPVCCGNVIQNALLDLQKLAESRGGQLVSTAYLGMQNKHYWRCSLGHEWEAKASHVKHSGSWCPICAGHVLIEPLKQLQHIAEERGGLCLSEQYVSSTTKLRWRCAVGHEWDAVPSSIKAGRWCPACATKQRIATRKNTHARRQIYPIANGQEIVKSRGKT
ncbi:MAG: hypothetical protein V5B40_04650 [Candidatus Accumulibacter meliphilus]|uniref:zinc-ribbon domain-containing protein n=1 Tax=Candidatus Accumulibacter meliphilus TaxID=2211374 RepID=UPI002FC316A1